MSRLPPFGYSVFATPPPTEAPRDISIFGGRIHGALESSLYCFRLWGIVAISLKIHTAVVDDGAAQAIAHHLRGIQRRLHVSHSYDASSKTRKLSSSPVRLPEHPKYRTAHKKLANVAAAFYPRSPQSSGSVLPLEAPSARLTPAGACPTHKAILSLAASVHDENI